MPGHGILVPEGPEKSQEKCARGNHVARGAPEELLRRGGIAGEALDLQTANHHSRRGSTKDREEAEVLDVDEGEGRETNGRAELAEGELPAQRAEKSEEAAIGKCQTSGINQSCDAARAKWPPGRVATAAPPEAQALLPAPRTKAAKRHR